MLDARTEVRSNVYKRWRENESQEITHLGAGFVSRSSELKNSNDVRNLQFENVGGEVPRDSTLQGPSFGPGCPFPALLEFP